MPADTSDLTVMPCVSTDKYLPTMSTASSRSIGEIITKSITSCAAVRLTGAPLLEHTGAQSCPVIYTITPPAIGENVLYKNILDNRNA